jgi:hypothetical protein
MKRASLRRLLIATLFASTLIGVVVGYEVNDPCPSGILGPFAVPNERTSYAPGCERVCGPDLSVANSCRMEKSWHVSWPSWLALGLFLAAWAAVLAPSVVRAHKVHRITSVPG